jgi:hypothetical protein
MNFIQTFEDFEAEEPRNSLSPGQSEVTDGCHTSDYEKIYEVELHTYCHQYFNPCITSLCGTTKLLSSQKTEK